MTQIIKASLIGIVVLSLNTACARKASEYSGLISAYKKELCDSRKNHVRSGITHEKRRHKIAELQEKIDDAMRFLKQEEKEKLQEQIAQVLLEVQSGKCQ